MKPRDLKITIRVNELERKRLNKEAEKKKTTLSRMLLAPFKHLLEKF